MILIYCRLSHYEKLIGEQVNKGEVGFVIMIKRKWAEDSYLTSSLILIVFNSVIQEPKGAYICFFRITIHSVGFVK
jgi:hypothetical protein